MSDGRFSRCPGCKEQKMLYPEYDYECVSCYEDSGMNTSELRDAIEDTDVDVEGLVAELNEIPDAPMTKEQKEKLKSFIRHSRRVSFPQSVLHVGHVEEGGSR